MKLRRVSNVIKVRQCVLESAAESKSVFKYKQFQLREKVLEVKTTRGRYNYIDLMLIRAILRMRNSIIRISCI